MQDTGRTANKTWRHLPATTRTILALGVITLVGACAQEPEYHELDPERQAFAFQEVARKQSRGQRVWCVPYARNLSGISIRGNAKDWWHKARSLYERNDDPAVGSVMSFRATRGMSLGHVAVVSEVVNDRAISVNHANWKRNQVTVKMGVIDVSKNNDWSLVRVESHPGQYGRSYPVNGFIHPNAPE